MRKLSQKLECSVKWILCGRPSAVGARPSCSLRKGSISIMKERSAHFASGVSGCRLFEGLPSIPNRRIICLAYISPWPYSTGLVRSSEIPWPENHKNAIIVIPSTLTGFYSSFYDVALYLNNTLSIGPCFIVNFLLRISRRTHSSTKRRCFSKMSRLFIMTQEQIISPGT